MIAGELRKALDDIPDETPVVLGWYYEGIILHIPFTESSRLPDPNTGEESLVLQESSL